MKKSSQTYQPFKYTEQAIEKNDVQKTHLISYQT